MSKPSAPPPLPISSGVYFPGAFASEVEDLSLPQKQELLYEVAKGSESGREALESWKRKDLLQLLCLEMGKERKYTGVSKSKMVEHLLRLVSTKEEGEETTSPGPLPPLTYPFVSQSFSRRQKKGGRSSQLLSMDQMAELAENKKPELSSLCRNTACRAQLLPDVKFCKRCSCCLCQNFDDNKDPSLWIVCTSEPLGGENDCGHSCHLECALDKGMAGVVMDGWSNMVLDGSYRCGPCGRISGLLGCWKKQLVIAKDARRVDILCQRLSLSHRLLNGSNQYRTIHEVVDRAKKKLEAEVGSITEGSAKLVRGIVNRLSCGADIQNMISVALDEAESLHREPLQLRVESTNLQEKGADTACKIDFPEVSSSSIVVTVKGGSHVAGEPLIGYRLWHRKARDPNYPNNPTCTIPGTLGRALISSLQACSEYAFRIVPFSERGIGGPAEARCFTKSIEVIKRPLELQPPLESHVNAAPGKHEDLSRIKCTSGQTFCNSDEFASNFKVRDLGKVLHSVWGKQYQAADVVEGIFSNSGRPKVLGIEGKTKERKGERISAALDVLLSHGAHVSGLEDGICKPDLNAAVKDLSAVACTNPGPQGGRVTVEAGIAVPPVTACFRQDSSGQLQENVTLRSSQDGILVHTKVTELDGASDPGNSQVSRREEMDAVSPDVSDSLQANGTNDLNEALEETCRAHEMESNGHGENWAVQVRNGGAAIGMEPQTAILRKTTGLERTDSCYGIVNGCGGTSSAVPLCAAKNYEFCVKIIRWLECEGHLNEDFRMKFLTWFSLRASEHEKRVVNVFIDTLQDNPASLGEQLVDTFSDIITSKRHQQVATTFCNTLWH